MAGEQAPVLVAIVRNSLPDIKLIRLSLFAALAIAATLPAHGALIHEYIFDGNVNDQVGLANDTLHGDATATGGTLSLDGSADWVSFNENLVPFGSDFTVILSAQFTWGNTQEFLSQGYRCSGADRQRLA